jgi:hypothetical protein
VVSGVLRAGLPLVFGAAASAACDEESDEDFDLLGCAPQIAGAALGGAVIAMVVDYAFLAHEPRRAAPPPVSVAVAPRADGGIALAIAGSF